MQEVVDGQQRLTTIYKFILDEYTVQGDISRKIIEYIIEYMGDEQDSKLEKLKKRLNNRGKIALKYSQLPESIINMTNQVVHCLGSSIRNNLLILLADAPDGRVKLVGKHLNRKA